VGTHIRCRNPNLIRHHAVRDRYCHSSPDVFQRKSHDFQYVYEQILEMYLTLKK
jgi:hypothetical protein